MKRSNPSTKETKTFFLLENLSISNRFAIKWFIPSPSITDELPIDVALGKLDYMEIVGFSDHRATAAVWYKLLNLGFRIPAGAGTDATTNYAAPIRGQVGMDRAISTRDVDSHCDIHDAVCRSPSAVRRLGSDGAAC